MRHIEIEALEWHDKRRINLIREYLDQGVSVAVFLIDGGWQYFGMQGDGIHKIDRLLRKAPETLVGIYNAHAGTPNVEQIILNDLEFCGMLAVKVHGAKVQI